MKMNYLKKIVMMQVMILVIMLTGTMVFASNFEDGIKASEKTEAFQNYTDLSKEEQSKMIMPASFEVPKIWYQTRNPLMLARNIGSSLEAKFSLKNIIPNNVVVRNQGNTNTCWAFAMLSSLETNLALPYGSQAKTYDFSEKHMNYATTRIFKNNAINPMGVSRTTTDFGNYNMAIAYLTNGMGAVDEQSMPFDDDTQLIELSEIQNKTVTSQIYDTALFPTYQQGDNIEPFKQQIKEHIKKYGAVATSIHGAQPISDFFNIQTGAMYCDTYDLAQYPINHGVSIVGWDDNYAISNFTNNHQPKNPGAWIVKNSWGDKIKLATVMEGKAVILQNHPAECAQKGWNEVSQIPNEFVKNYFEANGYLVQDDGIYVKYGDNGFIYISYEDVYVYTNLAGIVKASDEKDYENIYQYNEQGMTDMLIINDSKAYAANVFNKKTSNQEYLKQVSIYNIGNNTCNVYVNPNGTSLEKKNLQLVELRAGTSESIGSGYHTLELLNPIEIIANQFAVVVELQGNSNSNFIGIETNIPNSFYDHVTLEEGKCFFTYGNFFEQNEWGDLSKLSQMNATLPNADSTIKAFTVSSLKDTSLKNITITTSPTKTVYFEGENFDKTGMVVTAYYNDGTSQIVTDYDITNGTNLQHEQTSVTITYKNQTAMQPITVKLVEVVEPTPTPTPVPTLEPTPTPTLEPTPTPVPTPDTTPTPTPTIEPTPTPIPIQESKTLKEIRIFSLPTKTQYIQNQDKLDLTGGIVELVYDDGTLEKVSMTSDTITITGFQNKTLGKCDVTVAYEEFSTTFEVEIIAQPQPKNSNLTNVTCEVKGVKLYTFTDNSKKNNATIEIQIKNIKPATGNDKYEYYYYLSDEQEKQNITQWTKIEETQNTQDTLTFTVNISDLDNSPLATSDVLYVYLKEVAIKDGNQAVNVSKAILVETDENKVETYRNNIKIDVAKETNKNSSKIDINTNKTEDNTIADGTIPQTGVTSILTIVVATAIFGVFSFIRYQKVKKDLK